jgi:hypothetical protein
MKTLGQLVNETVEQLADRVTPTALKVREVNLLFGKVWPNFEEWASEHNIVYIPEATEAGTRYVIDFVDVPTNDNDHHL